MIDLQQATKSPYIGHKEASKCIFMYDEMLMMIFSFSIKQIMNKIICHKENLKLTKRDHHCKWVKWTLQTQQTTSHKIEAYTQIQHHTFFKKSTIITWSSHDKVKTNHWNSTTTLSHMRANETFSNSTTPIITRQWSKLFKFNYTHHHKTMKQIVQIQYDNIITSVKQTISKFNDHIIIRKWNKPMKFNTTNITRESDTNRSNSTPTLSWQENEINHSNLMTTISSSMSEKNHLNLIPTSSSSQEIETNSWN